ncbi:hypothetical protein, partial [Sedimenticola sp.]|uniref:hypothetical protein n=1 Tax=Sedimenticola sp. TaxID=1940285 RepID=UPI003D145359
IDSYSEYGTGDVVVKVNSPSAGCADGYWMSSNEAGSNFALSVLLTARAGGEQISIEGDQDRRWSGSSKDYCHIFKVGL